MPYKIIYDTPAEAVRRKLPLSAKLSLRAKLAAIARDLEQNGDRVTGGSRSASFGGDNQGIVVYIDTARRLITVTIIVWAK